MQRRNAAKPNVPGMNLSGPYLWGAPAVLAAAAVFALCGAPASASLVTGDPAGVPVKAVDRTAIILLAQADDADGAITDAPADPGIAIGEPDPAGDDTGDDGTTADEPDGDDAGAGAGDDGWTGDGVPYGGTVDDPCIECSGAPVEPGDVDDGGVVSDGVGAEGDDIIVTSRPTDPEPNQRGPVVGDGLAIEGISHDSTCDRAKVRDVTATCN